MILVCVEHHNLELRDCSLDLLAKAQHLGKEMDCGVAAVLLGSGVQALADRVAQYCDAVFVVDDPRLKNVDSACFEKAVSAIVEKANASLILLSFSTAGMELAPSLAIGLDAALATDCVELESAGQDFRALRKTHGGKVDTYVHLSAEKTVVSMRSGLFGAPAVRAKAGTRELTEITFDDIQKCTCVINHVERPATGIDITKADIIIDAGRGIKDEGDLELLRELADAFGGVLACSRPLVDLGWLDQAHQIGISGKTVKAKLLIAVGVSGSYQHLAGMDGCDTIVCINEDQNAPILNISDVAILEDLYEVIPVLTDKVKSLRNT